MKLSRFAILGLALGVLFLPGNSIADTIDPTAKWLGPWVYTPNPIVRDAGLGADSSAFRGNGAAGDAEDLSGTSASVFSRASADSAFLGGASASTGINFTRSFQLSGSPGGWDVTLSGRLVGLLFAVSPTAPSATVAATAKIAGGPSLTWGPTTIAPDRQRNIDDAMKGGPVLLADGTYVVTGSLTTDAKVDATFPIPFTSGGARADFASQAGDGLFVGVDATPVPEPANLTLLGIGLAALSQLNKLRKAKSSRQ
jgi:hypothetical protein